MRARSAGMSAREREAMMAKGREACACPRCPSYTGCSRDRQEVLFCALGATDCIRSESGCICPLCPVFRMMGLKTVYFCTRGSEEEQRSRLKEE